MKNIRGTVGRRIAVITAIALAATVLIAAVAWNAAGTVAHDAERASADQDARSLLERLDTRVADLKVDAFRSVTLSDPSEIPAGVADTTDEITGLIAELHDLDLDADDVERVDTVETALGQYADEVADFVGKAVADQDAMRERTAEIHQDGVAMDGVLGDAIDRLSADAATTTGDLFDTVDGMRFEVLLVALIGLAIASASAWAIVFPRPPAAVSAISRSPSTRPSSP